MAVLRAEWGVPYDQWIAGRHRDQRQLGHLAQPQRQRALEPPCAGSVSVRCHGTAGRFGAAHRLLVVRRRPAGCADGTVLWRYAPAGPVSYNSSIAIPLASNRIAICDDFGNRIIIVDPTTSRVVWEWSGNAAYHLVRPDGLDYRPS